MDWLAQASVGWLFAALLELIIHWFPWRMVIKNTMPWASIASILAICPYAVILLLWIQQHQLILSSTSEVLFRALITFLGTIISVILAILCANFIDWMLDRIRRSYEQNEIMKLRDDQTRQIRHSS